MIKKNDETGKNERGDRKIVSSFQKFSEMNGKKTKETQQGPELEMERQGDARPANPNLPTKSTKVEQPASTRYMKPQPELNREEIPEEGQKVDESNDVKYIGKVAKFPKKTQAAKAIGYLEAVKIPKQSIWYLVIEKQTTELQVIKFNQKKGVDLNSFVTELKGYYTKKYSSNPKVLSLIENINIDGNDKFSMIKNIPLIDIDGRKMITKITEDLIKLLSK